MPDWHSKYNNLLHITLDLMQLSNPEIGLRKGDRDYDRAYKVFRERIDNEVKEEVNVGE